MTGGQGGHLRSYPISVVIATRVGWPKIRVSVDPTIPQVKAVQGQLIIADSSSQPRPDWAAEDWVTWLSIPGATPYALRQAGYAAADAPVIVVTEDHCAPDPDWVAATIDEHQRNPNAAAIYGIVDNGSREHLIDWALYGAGYLSSAPPRPVKGGNPGHANLSFKTDVLRSIPATGDSVLEFRYINKLRSAGIEVLASERLRVTHLQSTGYVGTSKLFFNNGRYIAALRRQRMTGKDWLRTFAPVLLATYRTFRTLRLARSRPALRTVMLRSTPLIAMLHAIHAGGESVGYLSGAGDSASYLH
jgi:hypothetical protein